MQFSLRNSVVKGTQTGLKVLWELATVIIPAVVVVNVLDRAGILPHISRALGPVMGLFGLPGEGALVLVSANLVSTYAGLATLVALTGLTIKQRTILGIMMIICHGAISETALVSKAGAKASWVMAARFLAMIVVGLLMHWLWP